MVGPRVLQQGFSASSGSGMCRDDFETTCDVTMTEAAPSSTATYNATTRNGSVVEGAQTTSQQLKAKHEDHENQLLIPSVSTCSGSSTSAGEDIIHGGRRGAGKANSSSSSQGRKEDVRIRSNKRRDRDAASSDGLYTNGSRTAGGNPSDEMRRDDLEQDASMMIQSKEAAVPLHRHNIEGRQGLNQQESPMSRQHDGRTGTCSRSEDDGTSSPELQGGHQLHQRQDDDLQVVGQEFELHVEDHDDDEDLLISSTDVDADQVDPLSVVTFVREVPFKGRCLFSDRPYRAGSEISPEGPVLVAVQSRHRMLWSKLERIHKHQAFNLGTFTFHYAAVLSLLFLREQEIRIILDKFVPEADERDEGVREDVRRIVTGLDFTKLRSASGVVWPDHITRAEEDADDLDEGGRLHQGGASGRTISSSSTSSRTVGGSLPRLARPNSYEFTQDLIFKLVGAWRYNSFGHHTEEGLVLYNRISMCAHSCDPNCCWTYGEGDSFVLRARRFVAAGEEITISYLQDDDLLKSTDVRRKKLENWKFSCKCDRCEEAIDSCRGFRCLQCRTGGHLVYANADPVALTKCDVCGENCDDIDQIMRLEPEYQERILGLDKNNITDVQLVYQASLDFFHPRHWCLFMLENMLYEHFKERAAKEVPPSLFTATFGGAGATSAPSRNNNSEQENEQPEGQQLSSSRPSSEQMSNRQQQETSMVNGTSSATEDPLSPDSKGAMALQQGSSSDSNSTSFSSSSSLSRPGCPRIVRDEDMLKLSQTARSILQSCNAHLWNKIQFHVRSFPRPTFIWAWALEEHADRRMHLIEIAAAEAEAMSRTVPSASGARDGSLAGGGQQPSANDLHALKKPKTASSSTTTSFSCGPFPAGSPSLAGALPKVQIESAASIPQALSSAQVAEVMGQYKQAHALVSILCGTDHEFVKIALQKATLLHQCFHSRYNATPLAAPSPTT
ncbi:unnamed protein product [Amoebophrya sp. A25]|nr:unnamed protein product [Amoebophrya sp. A25]|eukprot:GSA25T00000133001.1